MKSGEIIELTVEGMDCNNCATSISRFLERKGLEDVFVNFQTKEVRFRQDEGKISMEGVKSGIHKLGYTVVESDTKEAWWTLERKLLISAIFTLPLLLGHLLMSFGVHFSLMHNFVAQLLLCLPVFVIGVAHFGKSAWLSLRTGVPNMDVLIFMGSTAAFIYSLIGTLANEAQYIFYETAASIITLVLIGNWLEKRAVAQTTTSISELSRLQPRKAKKIMPSGTIVSLDRDEIQKGDLLQVNDGDTIPADGVIQSGEAAVDESMLTGESMPVSKREGHAVIGGALLLSGNIRVTVQAVGKDTVLSQMIELVKTAQRDKPDIQRLADRISAIFVPAVVGISLLTLLLGYFVFDLAFRQALLNAIAVLVISCPCAMGLATPTAVMVGVGLMAQNGILIKGGQTLEILSRIRNFVFDKTGTLTTGDFKISNIQCVAADKPKVYALIHTLEQYSSHPIAKALVHETAQYQDNGTFDTDGLFIREEKGVGVVASAKDGRVYKLGSERILADSALATPRGAVYLTENDRLLAVVEIEDELKPETRQLIQRLHASGKKTVLLSGDKREKVEAVAQNLGIQRFFAAQLPQQKLDLIGTMSNEEPTAMIGDGINDAPALAKATVGISLSNASQVAIQSAQVVLMNGNIQRLSMALNISEKTVQTIRQNLFWAFAYNVVAIPIAAMGYLNPMWGALFMAFSDVVVIGNSIRLKYRRLDN
ncbi:MAG: cation-translocating P-type ATPase [Saprospiraceae bacterium]|nr:cation-translocating P-type ATPase [Saprospiraceae bacterium]